MVPVAGLLTAEVLIELEARYVGRARRRHKAHAYRRVMHALTMTAPMTGQDWKGTMRKYIENAFDFWAEAPIDTVILAAAGIKSDKIDRRFKAEIVEITPFDRACVLGARLAVGHLHYEAGQCPGEWAAVWALRNGFPAVWAKPENYDWGLQIRSIRSHVTGTGRLRWEAQEDGSLRVEVWRGPREMETEGFIVLSAIVRADEEMFANGIGADGVEVAAHGAFSVRHLDALRGALELVALKNWRLDQILARLPAPQPDPDDEANRPEWPNVGDYVHAVPPYERGFNGVVTDSFAYSYHHRGWGALVMDGDTERFVRVADITPIEGDG